MAYPASELRVENDGKCQKLADPWPSVADPRPPVADLRPPVADQRPPVADLRIATFHLIRGRLWLIL